MLLIDVNSPKLSKRGIVEPLDLTALFSAGMAFIAALNLVLARMMFRRHCGTPPAPMMIGIRPMQAVFACVLHYTSIGDIFEQAEQSVLTVRQLLTITTMAIKNGSSFSMQHNASWWELPQSIMCKPELSEAIQTDQAACQGGLEQYISNVSCLLFMEDSHLSV